MAESESANNSRNRTPEEFLKSYTAAKSRHPKIAEKINRNFKSRLDEIILNLAEKKQIDRNMPWFARAAHLFGLNEEREKLDQGNREVVKRLFDSRVETFNREKREKERQFQNYLLGQGVLSEKIESGLEAIADEVTLITRRIDILAKDANGVKTIIETKSEDWDARNSSKRKDLLDQIVSYPNEYKTLFPNEKYRMLLVLPEFTLDLYTSLRDRIREDANIIAFTYSKTQDGKDYVFSKVDFNQYEELIATKIANGQTFKQQKWPKHAAKKETEVPESFVVDDLIKSASKSSKSSAKRKEKQEPATPVKQAAGQIGNEVPDEIDEMEQLEKENANEYFADFEKIFSMLNFDNIVKNQREIEESLAKEGRSIGDFSVIQNSAIAYLENAYQGWKFAPLYEMHLKMAEKTISLDGALFPKHWQHLVIDSLEKRVLGFMSLKRTIDSEFKRTHDYADAELKKLSAKRELTDSEKSIASDLAELKRAALRWTSDATSYLFASRLGRLVHLENIWPYEEATNWPLAHYFLNSESIDNEEGVSFSALKERDDNALRKTLDKARSVFKNAKTIDIVNLFEKDDPLCDEELENSALVVLGLTDDERVSIDQPIYESMLEFNKNEELDRALGQLKEIPDAYRFFGPVPELPQLDGPKAFAIGKDYFRLLEEYQKLSNRLNKPFSTSDAPYGQGIEKMVDWIEEKEESVREDAVSLDLFALKARRSKAYEKFNSMRGDSDDGRMCATIADSMLLLLDMAQTRYWLDILSKGNELAFFEPRAALMYMVSAKSEFGNVVDHQAFFEFREVEKQIYKSIVDSCFRVRDSPAFSSEAAKQTIEDKPGAQMAEMPAMQAELAAQQLQKEQSQKLYELVLPSKYREWISDDAKDYIKNFVATDLTLLKLSEEKKMQLAEEIKHSKWYAPLHDKEMPDDKLYLFFDKMFLQIYNEKNDGKDKSVPTRHEIAKYFQSVCVPALKQKPLNNQSQL